jgi:hypothetical protein
MVWATFWAIFTETRLVTLTVIFLEETPACTRKASMHAQVISRETKLEKKEKMNQFFDADPWL